MDADVAFATWTARLPALLAVSPRDAPPLPLQQATTSFCLLTSPSHASIWLSLAASH